jgi:hypothetical protein
VPSERCCLSFQTVEPSPKVVQEVTGGEPISTKTDLLAPVVNRPETFVWVECAQRWESLTRESVCQRTGRLSGSFGLSPCGSQRHRPRASGCCLQATTRRRLPRPLTVFAGYSVASKRWTQIEYRSATTANSASNVILVSDEPQADARPTRSLSLPGRPSC